MNKKILLLTFLFIPMIVLAADITNNPNSFGNLLEPSFDYIQGYWGGSSDKVPGMFGYTLEPWELEVCASHLTSEMSNRPQPGFQGTSTDLTNIYASITAQISAQKTSYPDNATLYEVSWYVQPKQDAIKYTVILKGATTLYLKDFKNATSDPVQGAAGYFVEYFEANYTEAIITYGTGQIILQTPIMEIE